MRNLTRSQKKLLNEYIESHLDKLNMWFDLRSALDSGLFPIELYKKLEEINDTEILWNNIERYVADNAHENRHQLNRRNP